MASTWPTVSGGPYGRPPGVEVTRSPLVERLRRAVADPLTLTLLIAPAGAGKTTLLAQWQERTRPAAWVRVRPEGSSPRGLAADLLGALDPCWDGMAGDLVQEVPPEGDHMGGAFLAHLTAEADMQPDTVVVLDDVHHLSPPLLEDLTWLALHAPSQLHLVLSGRHELVALQTAAWLGRNVLTIGPRDLAFDADEVAALALRRGARPLSATHVDALLATTGGWPAPVALCMRTLRDADDLAGAIARFPFVDRPLHHYLHDEVISCQPPDLQEFLYATAVLDELSGPICDEVRERADSSACLDRLLRQGVPLLAVDPRGTSYRYHPLLLACLRAGLSQRQPDRRPSLLHRAAHFSLKRGQLLDAAHFLLQAEAFEETLELLCANAEELTDERLAPEGLATLQALPAAIRSRPEAVVLIATLCQLTGEAVAADDLLAELERRPTIEAPVQMLIDVVRCIGVQWHHPPADVLARARRLIAWTLPTHGDHPVPTAPTVTTIAHLSGGRALAGLGHHAEACHWYTRGLADPAVRPCLRAHLLGALGVSEATLGRLDHAKQHGQEALTLSEEAGEGRRGSADDAYLALGMVAYERSELAEASLLLQEAERRARPTRRTGFLWAVLAEHLQVMGAQGRPSDGLARLAELRGSGLAPPPPSVASRLAAVEARLLLASGAPRRARYVLSQAQPSPEIVVAKALVAACQGDLPRLEQLLCSWPVDETFDEPLPGVSRLLWQGIAARLAGEEALATTLIVMALERAEPEGLSAVFDDAERALRRVVRPSYVDHTRPLAPAPPT